MSGSKESGGGAPDSAEPILGWRAWRLDADASLRPLVIGNVPWAAGTNEARCELGGRSARRHTAPKDGCLCGFNALHEPPGHYRHAPDHAVGAIAAWGEVDVYRDGFRAQFACVLGLLNDAPAGSRHQAVLMAVAKRYGVPVLSQERLRAHALGFARPAGGQVGPGREREERNRVASPPAVKPSRVSGRGVCHSAHMAVDHCGRELRLGPTPSLAALATEPIAMSVAVGDRIEAGATVFVARYDRTEMQLPAPVAGTVTAVNTQVPFFEEGPARRGWLVAIRPDRLSIDHSPIDWGRRAAERYRGSVLSAGSDRELLSRSGYDLDQATSPAPDGAQAWLRAFAQQLDTVLRADGALCASLRGRDSRVLFDLEGVEELWVAPPDEAERRWVGTGRPPEPRGLHIRLGARALRRYWRGKAAHFPDDVSVEAPGVKVADRAPLHLRRGSHADLLVAISLHRRLFEAAREILDGLGNPWFAAAEAVRDPVRNLEVLAGFKPPEGLGKAA